jgi:hypothetical protein
VACAVAFQYDCAEVREFIELMDWRQRPWVGHDSVRLVLELLHYGGVCDDVVDGCGETMRYCQRIGANNRLGFT